MTAPDITRLALSAMITLGFGGVIIAWMIFPPTEGTATTLLAGLTGSLGTGYIQVLNFWFGKPSA